MNHTLSLKLQFIYCLDLMSLFIYILETENAARGNLDLILLSRRCQFGAFGKFCSEIFLKLNFLKVKFN